MKISENMKKKLMDETEYFGKVYYYCYDHRKGIVKKYSMWKDGTLKDLVDTTKVNWDFWDFTEPDREKG